MDAIGLELNKIVRNKDREWANTMVTQIRMYWDSIYPYDKAVENRKIMLGMQSMKNIEDKFKDSSAFKKAELPFKTLPIMHKIVNRLSELLIQYPPKCEVRASDPTALSGKEEDINRLRTRRIYENGVNRANGILGEPPERMDLKKLSSNLSEFDEIGLDDSDEEDLSTFKNFFQKMDYEISAQAVINDTMKINRFDEFNLREGFIDIASTNAICYDVYVDQMTGQQVIKRIIPENTKGLWGTSYDGHDDIAKGWEEPVTVREFLAMVGDNFDIQRDWPDLIWAINGANQQTFTGFSFSDGTNFDAYGIADYKKNLDSFGCNKSNIISLDQSYHFMVFMGKCEWYAPDIVGGNYLIDRITDQISVTSMSYNDWKSDKGMFEKYKYGNETRWVAYNAIYLAFTLTTQRIYKWGAVYLQQPEGANDEYCVGTLKYYRLPGLTIAEVSKQYLKVANEAFYKIKWILSEAKPRAKQVIFNEIIAMARALGTDKNGLLSKDGKVKNDGTDLLESVFNYMKEHVEYDIRFYPQVRGVDVPQLPSQKSPDEGIDPLTAALQLIEKWAEDQVMDKIGLYDLLNANPREGLGQQKMLTQESQHQIGYISRLIQFCKKDIATTLLTYTHDIIKYNQSTPCKWIRVLIGDEKFNGLKNLSKYSPHRMGIFINDYNTQKLKSEVDKMVDIALEKGLTGQEGGINIAQAFFLKSTEDFKREMKMLEVFIKQQDKKIYKRKVLETKVAQEHEKQMEVLRKETEKTKGDLALDREKVIADAQKYVADKNYQAKMDVKQITIDEEPQKQGIRATNQKDIETHKSNLQEQKAVSAP